MRVRVDDGEEGAIDRGAGSMAKESPKSCGRGSRARCRRAIAGVMCVLRSMSECDD